MGFMAGFLLAVPVGIYFGERGIGFPISMHTRDNSWGYVKIDLKFMETVTQDFKNLF